MQVEKWSDAMIRITHNDKQTNKHENGVDTAKFKHNTSKKANKKVSV